jgi:hypothetical protein
LLALELVKVLRFLTLFLEFRYEFYGDSGCLDFRIFLKQLSEFFRLSIWEMFLLMFLPYGFLDSAAVEIVLSLILRGSNFKLALRPVFT